MVNILREKYCKFYFINIYCLFICLILFVCSSVGDLWAGNELEGSAWVCDYLGLLCYLSLHRPNCAQM